MTNVDIEPTHFASTSIQIDTASPSTTDVVPKKRGRKKKVVIEEQVAPPELEQLPTPTKKTTKKRASKLHPVKVIENMTIMKMQQNKLNTNIILYLRCSLKEVEQYVHEQHIHLYDCTYNPEVPNDIKPYEPETNHLLKAYDTSDSDELQSYSTVQPSNSNILNPKTPSLPISKPVEKLIVPTEGLETHPSTQMHEQQQNEKTAANLKERLKELKLEFYRDEVSDRKPACFWCTCPYDNDTCYILQHSTQGGFLGHGSFCSPECSVAYLFKNMKWDDSAKMESYQLINYYYGEANQYTKNIKPANDPYYFLDKYYGNMSIREFRELSKSQHMLLCIDKPVTRVLPEIHEDNDKIQLNSTPSIQGRGNYKVKRQSEKKAGLSRNAILRDNFGVSS